MAIPLILASGIAAAYLSPWFFVLTLAVIASVTYAGVEGADLDDPGSFADADVVRHPLVAEIVRAYDRDGKLSRGLGVGEG